MKTVLVTGADRGLGFSLCVEFLRRDYLVFAGQFLAGWPELKHLECHHQGRLVIVPLDIGNDLSIERAQAVIAEHTAVLDVLVHNAGIIGGEDGFSTGVRAEENRNVFNVNSMGPVCVTRYFLPMMEAGSISLAHRDGMTGYCMSKAALNMAVRILNNDLGKRGYEIRLYHPGWMRTYMEGGELMNGELEPEVSAREAVRYFLKQGVEPLELVDVYGMAWPF